MRPGGLRPRPVRGRFLAAHLAGPSVTKRRRTKADEMNPNPPTELRSKARGEGARLDHRK